VYKLEKIKGGSPYEAVDADTVTHTRVSLIPEWPLTSSLRLHWI